MAGRWPQKQPAFAQAARKPRLPAFGADALMYRRQGMAVTALIVGLDHFNAGRAWATVRGALRVVVPADVRDVTAIDWTVAAGLDVVVDHCPELGDHAHARVMHARCDALVVSLFMAGANSVWVVWDHDHGPRASRVMIGKVGVMASGEVCAVETLPQALEALHDMQLVCGDGIFGTQAAVPARLARLNDVFGGDLGAVAQALGVDGRVAA
jgi:hypothetical protein